MAKNIEAIAKDVSKAVKNTSYNVFDGLDMSENDHTKLLLWLFRYETNGQFPILYSFLKKFATGCGKKINKWPKEVEVNFNIRFDNKTGKSKKEFSIPDGLILMTAKTAKNVEKKTAFIIENKIYNAPDQERQLSRYIEHVMNDCKVPIDNIWAFYLMADGSSKTISEDSYNPNDDTSQTYIGNRFVQLTYSEDILRWLNEDILNPRTYPETVTTAVRSYVDFLGTYFSSTDGKYNKAMKVLLKEYNLTMKVRDMEWNNIEKLYKFQEEVKKKLKELSEEKEEGSVDFDKRKTFNNIKTLDNVVRLTIKTIEDKVFSRFEEETAKILNELWSEKLSKIEKSWIVRHRGIGYNNKNGYVQIALTNDWATAHVEWIPIDVAKMIRDTNYMIELHFENDNHSADKWREELKNKGMHLKVKPGRLSRVYKFEADADDPLASMTEKQLKGFLDKTFRYLDSWFQMLIDHYDDY